MRRFAFTLSVVTAIAVAGAGCGRGSNADGDRLTKSEYQQQATAIGDELEKEFSDINEADEADIEGVPALMYRLEEALDALAGRFDELNPPEEIESEHNRLVSAARKTADEAREIGDRVKNEPLVELATNQDELDISNSKNFADVQEAVAMMRAKGYDFGDNLGG